MREIVKKVLKSCALGRLIYEPLHWCYRLYSVPHRRRVLRRHGKDVLSHLADVFKRRDIPGFLAAGTLLGFVRDGGFMSHDDDIDVGILPCVWTPSKLLKMLVEEEGFKFEFAYKFRGRTIEFKVSDYGVPIDFFCYERNGTDMYCTCFYYLNGVDYPTANANSAWRIHEYNVTKLRQFNANGVLIAVPSDPEKVLERLYGSDWRVPNTKWDDSMHPGREVMEGEFGYSVSYEEAVVE